jgi:mono/diheme cytochrome c family protein
MKRTGAVIVTMFVLSPMLIACESSSRALALIKEHKCRDCHTLKGKGGSSAPNLTTVGSRRDRAYIYQQIKAPKSHNPNTDMPSFGDRISDQDINILADYLAGLK